ncbi:MAG TPA: ribosome biogenesis GTPase Der [Chthonomonadales bacterium]|nr:ribosome biogenesis GTPase Der [Chthonomonadales bacterium]
MPGALVAIVGRPNVGKSTIFNRLAGRRIAIVEDTPGVTRDRLYARVEWAGREFTVVDTGGIVLNEADPLIVQVRLQAEIALAEADAILLVCDASEGVTAADSDLADALRSASAPVFVVVNKADSERLSHEATEFYALGLPRLFTVSAVHGHGVADLLDALVGALPGGDAPEEDGDTVRVAIIGRPNVGKSSLTNALTGEDRVIVSPIPGTTRDAIDTRVRCADGREAVLVDTAGIRRAGKVQGGIEFYTTLRARSAVDRSHVAVTVVDGGDGLTDGDKRVAGIAHEAGKASVIAVNKWDLVDPTGVATRRPDRAFIRAFVESFRRETPFLAYAPLVFCSALHGFSVKEVLETAFSAAANHAIRIPTGELNRLFRDAVEEHPRSERGRDLRLYYTTMARVQPPTVVLFVNDPDLVHFSYVRYLENRLRARYPLDGTPVVFRVRKAESRDRETS